MSNHRLLWGICIFLWLATSCELPFGNNDDDPTPGPEFIYVDDDFWSYVGLPENSYWIYQNIHTGEIDSSYTVGNIRYELRDPSMGRQRLRQWEESRLSALHLRNKNFECEWYTAKGDIGFPEDRKQNYFAMRCKESGNSISAAYKDSVSAWGYNDNSQANYFDTTYQTKSVGGREYSNVVHIQTGDTWENKAFITNAYYVKDIGAVYRQFSDGSEWALIRHHIGEQSPIEYEKYRY